jgi:hypothetical protein
LSAGSPTFGTIWISPGGSRGDQGIAPAIGADGPAIFIIISQGEEQLSFPILKAYAFALIREAAIVDSVKGGLRVAFDEG